MKLHSLKAKFIAIIISICLIVALVVLVAFTTSTGRIIDDLARRFVTREALLERNKIVSIIDREVVLAQKMADDITIRRWAGNEKNPDYRNAAFAQLESYRRLFRDRSFFVAIASTRHYYVYNKGKGHDRMEMMALDPAKPEDGWFYDGLRNINGYALNLDYNPGLQVAKVWFNAVMQDERGEKIGICGGGITLTDFLHDIVHAERKGVSTILIDRNGVIQAHEDAKIVEHNATVRDPEKKLTIFSMMKDPAARERLQLAVKSLLAGRSEVETFPASIDGKQYLLAVSSMKELGWLNVVMVDVSGIISMKEFIPIVAIMFLALLLAILVIGLFVNRLVLAPLARLSDASREVASGRYDISLPVTGRDELSGLTGSFNAMTATIQDYTNNLEAMVRQRTDELSAANRMLEDSQQRIMDSIGYARMIQESILPPREALEACLGEHFVLYRPKEAVGGDFYYLREFPDHFLVAVIDCTGHGIPGAFMTMTVNSVLNHVVDTHCNDNPSRILSGLNRVMRSTLQLRDLDAGLDIAICVIERGMKRLTFAGAGLSLYVASAAGVHELRGNHQRIGYKRSRLDYDYASQPCSLSPGDCCYLATDGLLDEPGGRGRYGFGTERFKAMLAEYASLGMHSQLEAIERTLRDYRGDNCQRDDITLLGFRCSTTASGHPAAH